MVYIFRYETQLLNLTISDNSNLKYNQSIDSPSLFVDGPSKHMLYHSTVARWRWDKNSYLEISNSPGMKKFRDFRNSTMSLGTES